MEARISAPIQTSPGAHPASYRMDTRSFLGIKRPVCGIHHPPTSNIKVKERIELYIYSPFGPSWFVLGRTKRIGKIRIIQDFRLKLPGSCGLCSSTTRAQANVTAMKICQMDVTVVHSLGSRLSKHKLYS